MKFLILACLCATALAQKYEEYTTPDSAVEEFATNAPQELRSNYRTYDQSSNQQQVTNKRCIEKNERYPIPGSCDRYIECLNGTATDKTCPDGLRYNPNVTFNRDPCQYPIDVECIGRASLQPAQPTEECPHQFGYFKRTDGNHCGKFRNCVNGVAFDFDCPEGLAFNSESYRCDWPDQVKDCDVEAYLGFRCPEVPELKDVGPPTGFRFYRSPSNCQQYFICVEGKPRRLACSGYNAFDEEIEGCVAADEVSACPADIKERAARSRKEEEQRVIEQQKYYERLKQNPQAQLRYAPTEPSYNAYEEATTVSQ
ncbi:protein obstructor-E-like [Aricia agestis]|uniref:protein obstructor-E-like n=1 Tax=Aricia agestis TaxID=91739 RepID=UPI001C20918F|nr:protein obstructor-E-like [Aricia agestis]